MLKLTRSTDVWHDIFNAITLFINITIAKAQLQYRIIYTENKDYIETLIF
jgi:hypothetical protein